MNEAAAAAAVDDGQFGVHGKVHVSCVHSCPEAIRRPAGQPTYTPNPPEIQHSSFPICTTNTRVLPAVYDYRVLCVLWFLRRRRRVGITRIRTIINNSGLQKLIPHPTTRRLARRLSIFFAVATNNIIVRLTYFPPRSRVRTGRVIM